VIWLLFAIWLAWTFYRKRSWAEGRMRYAAIPRGRRIAMSVGAAILAPAILLAGLLLLSGIGAPATVTYAIVALLGVIFIEIQMAAVAITGSLVADTVTANRRPSSKIAAQEEEE
jgi:hypothetical protein